MKWQDYTSGVMSMKTCGKSNYNSLDHCVQLVGYTADYWLVRNSWASDWGVGGYIHLEADTNTCGVADWATFPTIKV
jgi:C1A family cysteine protease